MPPNLKTLAAQKVLSCDALHNDNNGLYVLLLKQNKIIEQRVQKILVNQQTNHCALAGVAVGDQVLAGNVLTVKSGDVAQIMK